MPLLYAGKKSGPVKLQSLFTLNDSIGTNSPDAEMESIYDSLKLQKRGLRKEAFKYAYLGYKKLEEEGQLNKEGIITICDFSQSSKRKRLYVIDLKECKLLLNAKQVVNEKHSDPLILLAFEDISEQKGVLLLEESEERFRILADSAPALMTKLKEERSLFMVHNISEIITGDGANSWVAALVALPCQ